MADDTINISLEFDANTDQLSKEFDSVAREAGISGARAATRFGTQFARSINRNLQTSLRAVSNVATQTAARIGGPLRIAVTRLGRATVATSAALATGLVRGLGNVGRAAGRAARQLGGRLRNSLNGIPKVALAAAAALGAVFATRVIVQAATRQEDAINSLNASLQRIGEFSQEASQDLQDFASALQATTRFGDEAVIEQLAFAQSLGATAEQSKDIVAAATDLSAALNIDLNSAVRNVARTLGGFSGELGEVIPELRNLTKEQLQSGAAIDLLAQKFQGIAASQIRTFSGSLTQAGNAFGDLLESLGSFITQSPTLIGLFNGVRQVLANLATSLGALSGSDDFLKPLIETGLLVAQTYAGPVTTAIVGLGRAFDVVVSSIATGIDTIVAVLANVAAVAGNLGEQFGLDSDLVQNLRDFQGFANEELGASVKELNNDLTALGQPIDTSGVTESIAIIQEAVAESQRQAREDGAIIPPIPGVQTPGSGDDQEEQEDPFTAFGVKLDFLTKRAKRFELDFKKISKSVANAAVQGFGRGVGSAFDAFGRAIVTGQDALAAFGNALLSTFGQALSQLGQGFILQGIAQSIAGFGSGAPLIAAGIALTVFGGALSGLGGGGAPSLSGGGVGNAAFTPTDPVTDNTLIDQQEEREGPSTQVSVNIQGDVLDSEDTGLRLVQVLNNAFDQQGVVITNGSFA